MRIPAPRLGPEFVQSLLDGDDPYAVSQRWAHRLRRGRDRLSPAERDVQIVTDYVQWLESSYSFPLDAPERTGHLGFLATTPVSELPRVPAAVARVGFGSLESFFRRALSIVEADLDALPTQAAWAIRLESSPDTIRMQLRVVDEEARSQLPATLQALHEPIMQFMRAHAAEILGPEQTPPPPADAAPAATAPPPVWKTWEEARIAIPAELPGYEAKRAWQVGDWLLHPKFGPGFVHERAEARMKVLFEDGERVLACGR